jgi:uncharacterized membrane protein YdfJ with MMPL/SSD domain
MAAIEPCHIAAIDATVVRAVLLPVTMKVLGDWNRYLRAGLAGCRT